MFYSLLASIPSPSSNGFELGPLSLRFYGLCIGIGVVAGITIASKRWAAKDGNPDDVAQVALIATLAGLWGAKIYHVITDGKPIVEIFKVWTPGLGIPGGLVVGLLAGWLAARRRKLDIGSFIFAVIPAIPIAQAIGRFGNWFNQELYGRPTDVPWALEIDPEYRVAGFEGFETFHPTFLYEALWSVGLFALLVFLGRKGILKGAQMLPAYIAGYSVGRFWVESLRIDNATEIEGIRVNNITSGVAAIAAIMVLVYMSSKDKSADNQKVVELDKVKSASSKVSSKK